MGLFDGSRARALWAVGVLAAAGGCGGGGDGSGPGAQGNAGQGEGPPPPAAVALATANGNVLVDWPAVQGASGYVVRWSLAPAAAADGAVVTAAAPPVALDGLPGGETLVVAVSSSDGALEDAPSPEQSIVIAPGGPEQYFPAWWDAPPLATLEIEYDPSKTSAQNGAALKAMVAALAPGDRLEVGGGTWTIDSLFDVALKGTASAPIRVAARAGETPVITRSDASQNTVNVGAGAPARYLALEGLEITGGDIALRLYDCAQIWIDRCHVHDCASNAIAANSHPVDHLYFTRNLIHGTGGTGEGLYLGGNLSDPVAHGCVIALNHVFDTGGTQGDGIEVKQGSWGNRIAENLVHDTLDPCILVYGTDGNPPNVIERNVCVGSDDNVMQVQGEAIVRNNVLAGGLNGFASHDHQGEVRDLVVVHNTIVNAGTAARLSDWSGRPGMVFANNACTSLEGYAIQFAGGSAGVAIAGNVASGPVIGAATGYALGAGLADFVAADADGAPLDVTPYPSGALIDAGDPAHAVLLDATGGLRLPPLDAGAVDG